MVEISHRCIYICNTNTFAEPLLLQTDLGCTTKVWPTGYGRWRDYATLNCPHQNMITSSNGNIFRVTSPLCGEFTGQRWIPLPRGQWRGALMFSSICTWTHGWGNNRDAGDLRRHWAQCDVTVTVTLRVQLWTCHACDYLFTMDHTILDGILCSTHCCAVLACWMAYVFGPFLSGVYTSSCFSVTCT